MLSLVLLSRAVNQSERPQLASFAPLLPSIVLLCTDMGFQSSDVSRDKLRAATAEQLAIFFFEKFFGKGQNPLVNGDVLGIVIPSLGLVPLSFYWFWICPNYSVPQSEYGIALLTAEEMEHGSRDHYHHRYHYHH